MKGVKLDPNASSVKRKSDQKKEFEKAATEALNNSNELQQQMLSITQLYIEALKDTTLPVNKNPNRTEIESQIIRDMVVVMDEMNNSPSNSEGIGAVAGVNLLMKILYMFRDRINQLAFQNSQLTQELERLKRVVEPSESK